ncbi:MAG TPA: hypothetical protein VNZ03_06725 [Terriglobales bacterium]|jgi:hypothetical protein|nr:hypothetical protein [Terriglobales bacterium]
MADQKAMYTFQTTVLRWVTLDVYVATCAARVERKPKNLPARGGHSRRTNQGTQHPLRRL